MSIAGDYIGRVRLGVTIGADGTQSFTWPDGRPTGTYTADAGPDGAIELTVTEPDANTITVAWAGTSSRRMIGHPWRVLRDGTWLFGDLYVTEAEPTDQDPADYTVLDGAVEVTVNMVAPAGGGGVTDHGDLTGRDETDQHSADAITVPPGTVTFIEEFYPPATDNLTDHLDEMDNAIEAAAGGIVGAYAQVAALDGRVETAEDGIADLTSRTITAGTGLTGGGSLDADRTLAVSYGTTAGTAAQGNDARLSDARTPTAHTHAGIGSTVDATSDTAARTSTTAAADGVLEFPVVANTSYRFDLYAIFQGDATADLKFGFTTPTGTIHATVEGALTTVASGSDYDRFLTLTSSGQTAVVGVAGASTPISVRISGVVHPTADGTVALIWAPNAAGAGTGVTRLARSQLYYRAA